MTSRERMLAAMRCEPVDRVPCGPFGLGHLDIDSPVARELIRRTDIFVPCSVKGDWVLGRNANDTIEERGSETILTHHTPSGDLTRRIGHSDKATATVEYPLKELEDIERLLSVEYEEPEVDATAYFRMQEHVDDEGLVLCGIGNAVSVPADWFGPEKFCLFWATARDDIIELTRKMNERLCAFVEQCCRAGVTDFRIVGGEYVSVQIGPSGMPALIREPDRRLIDIIHAHGGVAFYHNHGPVMRYLEDFAATGLDFLEPMEAPPWGDADLGAAKRVIGDRYCMVGNVDDMEILEKLDADAVRVIARERIEQAGTGGFVLGGTASGTYTEKAAYNFMAMAEVAAEYGNR